MNKLITDALLFVAMLVEPLVKRWRRKLLYVSFTGSGPGTRTYDDGSTGPDRWYHRASQRVRTWWSTRDWRRRQKEFKRTGTRYYGNGGTIHSSGVLDVEVHEGKVVAVWFRCQALPFRQANPHANRATEMRRMSADVNRLILCGVEIKDPEK